MEIAIGLFALAYSGLVLFVLAASLRKIFPPVRAAWVAFGLSVLIHAATLLVLPAGQQGWALVFVGVPHLLLLPLLLWSAAKQTKA
jgi:hypothetical protein